MGKAVRRCNSVTLVLKLETVNNLRHHHAAMLFRSVQSLRGALRSPPSAAHVERANIRSGSPGNGNHGPKVRFRVPGTECAQPAIALAV